MGVFADVLTDTYARSLALAAFLPQAGQMVASLDPTMPVIADADTGYASHFFLGTCRDRESDLKFLIAMYTVSAGRPTLHAQSNSTFRRALRGCISRTRFRRRDADISWANRLYHEKSS